MHGLAEETRTEIELHGRVSLSQENLDYLKVVKMLWLIAIPPWLILGDNNGTLLFVPFCGIVEAVVSKPGSIKDRAMRVLLAVAKVMLGMLFNAVTMNIAMAMR